MTKREYIIKVFESLKGISPVADNIALLLSHTNINEETMDQIIAIFKESMKGIKNEEAQKRAEKGLEILERMKQMEVESKKKDEEDLKNLDELIAGL